MRKFPRNRYASETKSSRNRLLSKRRYLSFMDLPDDMLLHILTFLQTTNLRQVNQVSRLLRALSNSNEIWHQIYNSINSNLKRDNKRGDDAIEDSTTTTNRATSSETVKSTHINWKSKCKSHFIKIQQKRKKYIETLMRKHNRINGGDMCLSFEKMMKQSLGLSFTVLVNGMEIPFYEKVIASSSNSKNVKFQPRRNSDNWKISSTTNCTRNNISSSRTRRCRNNATSTTTYCKLQKKATKKQQLYYEIRFFKHTCEILMLIPNTTTVAKDKKTQPISGGYPSSIEELHGLAIHVNSVKLKKQNTNLVKFDFLDPNKYEYKNARQLWRNHLTTTSRDKSLCIHSFPIITTCSVPSGNVMRSKPSSVLVGGTWNGTPDLIFLRVCLHYSDIFTLFYNNNPPRNNNIPSTMTTPSLLSLSPSLSLPIDTNTNKTKDNEFLADAAATASNSLMLYDLPGVCHWTVSISLRTFDSVLWQRTFIDIDLDLNDEGKRRLMLSNNRFEDHFNNLHRKTKAAETEPVTLRLDLLNNNSNYNSDYGVISSRSTIHHPDRFFTFNNTMKSSENAPFLLCQSDLFSDVIIPKTVLLEWSIWNDGGLQPIDWGCEVKQIQLLEQDDSISNTSINMDVLGNDKFKSSASWCVHHCNETVGDIYLQAIPLSNVSTDIATTMINRSSVRSRNSSPNSSSCVVSDLYIDFKRSFINNTFNTQY